MQQFGFKIQCSAQIYDNDQQIIYYMFTNEHNNNTCDVILNQTQCINLEKKIHTLNEKCMICLTDDIDVYKICCSLICEKCEITYK